MSIEAEPKRSFWQELKRRNIYRVGIAFIVGGWLALQFLDVVLPMIGAPDWIGKLVLVLLLLAFPIVIVLSWVYELTPDGLMRQSDVDLEKSITAQTGHRLDLAIVGLLILAVGWQATDRWLLPEAGDAPAHRVAPRTEPSIAVLPFANMSADASSRHFSDGLADTLLHMLAQVRELRVAARTSSFQFRDTNNDVRTIATVLGVAAVLEGSVQKAGNEIRVTAQLVDADTGFHLWSGIYERPFDDIFEIQDEIATQVVDALKVSLLGGDAERLQRHATDNIDAYTAYLLGIDDLSEFSFESLRRALGHFRAATAMDPNYTLAYVGIGRAALEMTDTGAITEEEMLATARPAIARALELDAELPDALVTKAVLDYVTDERDFVERTFRDVIRRAPNNVFARKEYATFLTMERRYDEALAMLDEVLALDPLSLPALHTMSHAYSRLNRHEDALTVAARMREINPRAPGGYYRAGFTERDRGNWADGILWVVKAAEVDPGDPELPAEIGDYYLNLSLTSEALRWYEHAMRVDPTHPMSRSSMLVEPLLAGDVGSYTRLARELLVGDIGTRKGSREVALEALALAGDASGDYSEFLTWMRRFEPGLFSDPPAVGERNTVLAGRTARALIDSGDAAKGARLLDAARAAQSEADARDGFYWSSLVVAAAADDVDAVMALLGEFIKAPWRLNAWNLLMPQPVWLAPYIDNPVYAEVRNRHRAHAERQQKALLEKNGGRFPLPQDQ